MRVLALFIVLLFRDSTRPVTALKVLNQRPIVGILAQEVTTMSSPNIPKGKFSSYIAASYVKSIEATGARVVPIMIGKSRKYYKNIIGKINGILLPGGATYFNTSNGYADAGQHIFELAKKLNAAGDYFPVFGVCMGFELLISLDLGRNQGESRVPCNSHQNVPLYFTPGYRQSKMFNNVPNDVSELLQRDEVLINVHDYCFVDDAMKKFGLDKNWTFTSYSYDENGVRFIATSEHKRYPFFGTQFHPEKVMFEWKRSEFFVHSANAVIANRYFPDFFVSECRKNDHSFPDEVNENQHLIYNYMPYFTGANDSYYTQCYLF